MMIAFTVGEPMDEDIVPSNNIPHQPGQGTDFESKYDWHVLDIKIWSLSMPPSYHRRPAQGEFRKRSGLGRSKLIATPDMRGPGKKKRKDSEAGLSGDGQPFVFEKSSPNWSVSAKRNPATDRLPQAPLPASSSSQKSIPQTKSGPASSVDGPLYFSIITLKSARKKIAPAFSSSLHQPAADHGHVLLNFICPETFVDYADFDTLLL
ncbi:hypothetical protein BDZ97DRAFT_1919003 [Flammula alnicola]|nr:hypothetical protein BDZ97DRAFT_1919003 [Flammula alnicola]